MSGFERDFDHQQLNPGHPVNLRLIHVDDLLRVGLDMVERPPAHGNHTHQQTAQQPKAQQQPETDGQAGKQVFHIRVRVGQSQR
jgi:hypothetical protein